MFPIIDCHCHIYPDKIAEKAAQGIGKFYNIGMQYDGKATTLYAENVKHGITHSLIFSVATKPQQTQSINNFIAEKVASDRSSFTGLGTLHPDTEELDSDIEHIINLDLRGVKLHPDFQCVALDDKRCYNIFEKCQGRLPVLLHTGDIRYDYSNPNRLKKVLKDFPNLTVIGAHFGGYSVWDDAVKNLGEFDNFYVDCSSSLAFMSTQKAQSLVDFYGAQKILFGTDFPMWNFGEELLRFNALNLDEEQKSLIFYKNACKLFGIDQTLILKKFANSKK